MVGLVEEGPLTGGKGKRAIKNKLKKGGKHWHDMLPKYQSSGNVEPILVVPLEIF
jgi:hypothetical protein